MTSSMKGVYKKVANLRIVQRLRHRFWNVKYPASVAAHDEDEAFGSLEQTSNISNFIA